MKLSRDKTADFKHFSTQLCNWGDTKGRLHCEEKRREKEQWAPRVVRKLKSMEKQKAQRTASGPRSSVGASSKVVCSALSSLGGDTSDLQWNQDDVNSLHWSTMSNEISSEVSQQRRDHDRADSTADKEDILQPERQWLQQSSLLYKYFMVFNKGITSE